MRPLLLLCLLLGCTRPGSTAPSTRPDATAPAEPTTTVQPVPPPESAPRAKPDGPPAGAQAGECTSDTDCGLTLVREGECCPMMCTPRGVTARQAQALERQAQACEQRQPCAVPMCAPPHRQPMAVCKAGRCAVRLVDLETRSLPE